MKKVLSVFLSALMIFSAVIPVSAFADTKTTTVDSLVETIVGVKTDMINEIAYLKTAQTVANSYEVHKVAQAGGDVSTYIKALDDNLKANKGLIKAKQSGEESDSESLVYYAVAIDVLTILDKDVTNYNGYNIKEAFVNFANKSKAVVNPYFYRCIIEACKTIGNNELGRAFVDQMINDKTVTNGYTMGSGFDYWGVSCDNTAMFASSIAPYKTEYNSYFDDALTVVAKYKKTKGYYSDDKYTTSENADSTAYAIMAYSLAGDFDKADEAYTLLKNFESTTNNGVMLAANWQTGVLEENAYATADALRALPYFYDLCVQKLKAMTGSSNVPEVKPETKPTTPSTSGTTTSTKPAKTKISKISTGKKSITAQWKKVSGVSGYQLQIATNSKFSKNKKTFKVSKKSTKAKVNNLKSKKTYYVRLRSYKTVNGKKTYSKWSTVRKVKTK